MILARGGLYSSVDFSRSGVSFEVFGDWLGLERSVSGCVLFIRYYVI